jgi:hypothetical protein
MSEATLYWIVLSVKHATNNGIQLFDIPKYPKTLFAA